MSHHIDVPNLGTVIPRLGISMAATSSSTLADALFTSTQQKVLGLLFGQPGRSFFVTQIMEIAKSGRGAVQRELRRLERAGVADLTPGLGVEGGGLEVDLRRVGDADDARGHVVVGRENGRWALIFQGDMK